MERTTPDQVRSGTFVCDVQSWGAADVESLVAAEIVSDSPTPTEIEEIVRGLNLGFGHGRSPEEVRSDVLFAVSNPWLGGLELMPPALMRLKQEHLLPPDFAEWHRAKLRGWRIIDSLSKKEEPQTQVADLSSLTALGREVRDIGGPRGTPLKAAMDRISDHVRARILTDFATQADNLSVRGEAALALGEWGGEYEARELCERLRTALHEREDDRYQGRLVSAIGNLAGPEGVSALIEAAGIGSERVRLGAISALENLFTRGATALTEYPEASRLDPGDANLRRSYEKVRDGLSPIVKASDTPELARLKAQELLGLVDDALGHNVVG